MTDLTMSRVCWLRLGFVAFAIFVAHGCQSEVELGDVRGKVTMDGEPLPNATIRFIPTGGGRSALGRTNAEGEYQMQYSATASGALVGPVRVEITVAEEVEDRRGHTYMSPELVPEKYNVKSELSAEITRGNNLHNFDLQSK